MERKQINIWVKDRVTKVSQSAMCVNRNTKHDKRSETQKKFAARPLFTTDLDYFFFFFFSFFEDATLREQEVTEYEPCKNKKMKKKKKKQTKKKEGVRKEEG